MKKPDKVKPKHIDKVPVKVTKKGSHPIREPKGLTYARKQLLLMRLSGISKWFEEETGTKLNMLRYHSMDGWFDIEYKVDGVWRKAEFSKYDL